MSFEETFKEMIEQGEAKGLTLFGDTSEAEKLVAAIKRDIMKFCLPKEKVEGAIGNLLNDEGEMECPEDGTTNSCQKRVLLKLKKELLGGD